jgi:hypothetical protein
MTMHVAKKPISVCYIDVAGKKLRAFCGCDNLENAVSVAKQQRGVFGRLVILDYFNSKIITTI